VRLGESIHQTTVSQKHQGLRRRSPKPLSFMVAGARNHLPKNRPVEFRFEVITGGEPPEGSGAGEGSPKRGWVGPKPWARQFYEGRVGRVIPSFCIR